MWVYAVNVGLVASQIAHKLLEFLLEFLDNFDWLTKNKLSPLLLSEQDDLDLSCAIVVRILIERSDIE